MTDAEELDLLRRRVVNVVGHELRTPVTTLRGLAESLAGATDPATAAALTSALVRSAQRLEELLDDLLLASGVITAVPTDLADDVDLAAALAGAGWTGAVAGAGCARVRPESARRLLEPIVENASRHGEPVEARIDGSTVEIESAGVELPPGDVALACEPFFRGEAAVMTAPGLGLGLAIARTVARAEGGDVTVRSRDGGGLIVRVELAPCGS